MALNFAEAATKRVAEIEKPPLPPVGTYRWSVTKLPEITTTQDGAWDIVTYNVRAIEALDDVDMDGYKGEVTNITSQVKFMFNKNDEVEFEKSEFRHRTFLEKHVRCADDEMSIAQAMNASVNQQFLGKIVWNPGKAGSANEGEFFANLQGTAPLD